jgi:hypothetical protein
MGTLQPSPIQFSLSRKAGKLSVILVMFVCDEKGQLPVASCQFSVANDPTSRKKPSLQ